MNPHLLLQLEKFGKADPVLRATAHRANDGNENSERICCVGCHSSAHTVPSLKLIPNDLSSIIGHPR